jgi:phospholipase C
LDIFRDDVQQGRLPQVSWIVAPEAYTEHPNWIPDVGAWYVSQVIDVLPRTPTYSARQFSSSPTTRKADSSTTWCRHTAGRSRAGLSTVPITNEIYPGDAGHAPGPYGFGIRVR